MQFTPFTSPHTAMSNHVPRVMGQVLIALIPGFLALLWFFGFGVLINVLIAGVTALAAEAFVLWLRRRPILPVLKDLSAVVTAVLFALAIPPLLPWWMTVLGMLFAIIIVKQLYGGIGYNPFNPAMAAYVLLLISYPVEMTSWLPPHVLADTSLSFFETVNAIFTRTLPPWLTWDTLSAATPLDSLWTQLDQGRMISEIRQDPLWGDFGGRGWEWVGNWFLLGGLWLLYRKVISWQIPVAMLGTLLGLAMVFYLLDPERYPFALFHLFSGGAILGAFFIATDPVTASTTPRGQLIYGAGIGLFVFVIRSWGGYPDAVAFSVLLMNMAAPTIDYYTQPRVFGQTKESSS